jgi:hypothetical protein
MGKQPIVKSINLSEAKDEVAKCNQIVRDYVRSLENIVERNKDLQVKMMNKIRKLSWSAPVVPTGRSFDTLIFDDLIQGGTKG